MPSSIDCLANPRFSSLLLSVDIASSSKLDEKATTGRPDQEVYDWLRGKSRKDVTERDRVGSARKMSSLKKRVSDLFPRPIRDNHIGDYQKPKLLLDQAAI